MQKLIYLISLLLTFLQIVRDGLVICWQMMVEGFTWIIKNGKNPLYTILNKTVELLFLTLALVVFLLMMAFFSLGAWKCQRVQKSANRPRAASKANRYGHRTQNPPRAPCFRSPSFRRERAAAGPSWRVGSQHSIYPLASSPPKRV